MSSLAERLDGIRFRVFVPGVDISAELRDRKNVTLAFGNGIYSQASEKDLERHLGTLARLLFVQWVREYQSARGEDYGIKLGTQADRDYEQARAEIVAIGQSDDGRVRIRSRGMQSVEVIVAAGTVREVSEVDFVGDVRQAVTMLIDDHMTQILELKRRIFG